jgi:hypothetical protein
MIPGSPSDMSHLYIGLTPATPAASVPSDGPSAWKVKREAGAIVINAGAAPATVSDEPSPVPLGIPGKAAIRQRPASQETCHHELCFGGVVGAGCTGRERAGRRVCPRRDPTKLAAASGHGVSL